jgi:hypothetical protein
MRTKLNSISEFFFVFIFYSTKNKYVTLNKPLTTCHKHTHRTRHTGHFITVLLHVLNTQSFNFT